MTAYKRISPYIIKSFLNKEELSVLKKISNNHIINNEEVLLFSWWGRASFMPDFPQNIFNKLQAFANTINDEFEIFARHNFVYSGKYGTHTHLPPHQDESNGGVITFDIQIDSNVTWPIVIEGKEFILEDGDLLVFEGFSTVHWRTEKFLNETEFVNMFSVSYGYSNHEERVNSGEIPNYKIDVDYRTKIALSQYNASFDITCNSNDMINHSSCTHPSGRRGESNP